jgi:hypothetical protein
MPAPLEQIVEEIERRIADGERCDLGDWIADNWPALRVALSPDAAIVVHPIFLRPSDSAAPAPSSPAAQYEPQSDARARGRVEHYSGAAGPMAGDIAAVLSDLTRCESALSAAQARVGELEAERDEARRGWQFQQERAERLGGEQHALEVRVRIAESARDAALARAEDHLSTLQSWWLWYDRLLKDVGLPPDTMKDCAGRTVANLAADKAKALARAEAESAWLIERGGLALGFCRSSFSMRWHTFDNAIRFARREDAETAIQGLLAVPGFPTDAVAAEHEWIGPERAALRPPVAGGGDKEHKE